MEYELVVARSLAAENAALSSKVSAQNAELEKLRAEVADLPGLMENWPWMRNGGAASKSTSIWWIRLWIKLQINQ